MKKIILILFCYLIACFCAVGQSPMPSVVNAAGGSWKNGSAVYEWSIGELALVNEMQSADDNIIITNGFLQTYAGPGKKDSIAKPFTGKEIHILPNPTKGKLQVNFALTEPGRLKLAMCDELGFIIYKKELFVSGAPVTEIINMEGFASGNYFLVMEMLPGHGNTKRQQSFKIIKIH
jgi:hypothetical protein